MVTRRAFLGGGAALTAAALLRAQRPVTATAVSPRRARTIVAPASIDNTGATNVSAQLTDWLVTAGRDGSVLKLRRQAGYAPGVYWVPQGVDFRRHEATLDLNGCWLHTGFGSGAEFEPLWPHQSQDWPRKRYTLGVSGDFATVRSSLPNAFIWGGNDLVEAGNAESQFVAYVPDYEAQHGIQIDDSYGPVEIDLSKIEVAYTFGDGIYIGGPHDVTIRGAYNDGGDPLWVPSGGATNEGERWVPTILPTPGIHHVGRHGVAPVAVTNCDIVDLPLWSVKRTLFDMEPPGGEWTVDGVRILNGRQGVRGNGWVGALGAGAVQNVEIRDNVSFGSITVNCVAPDHRPRVNWSVVNNRGLQPHSSANSPVMRFWNTSGIEIIDNLQDAGTLREEPVGFGPGTSDIIVDPPVAQQFPG